MTRASSAVVNFSAWTRRELVRVVGDVEQVLLPGRGLHQQQIAEMGEGLGGDVAEVLAVLDEPADDLERPASVAHRHRVRELVLDLAARGAQQGADRVVVDRLAAEHAGLVEQRERVARGPLGVTGDRLGGGRR